MGLIILDVIYFQSVRLTFILPNKRVSVREIGRKIIVIRFFMMV